MNLRYCREGPRAEEKALSTDLDDLEALRARVRRLEDVERARGLLYSYAAALDTPVPDSVAALFTSDAALTTSRGAAKGRTGVRAYYADAFERDPSVKRHFVVSPRATWLAPGRVRMQSYFLYVGSGDEASIIGWGTYDDVIDVSGDDARFAAKVIDVHLGTDLRTGWALPGGPG